MIEYKDINVSEIELIKELWYKNLDYHYELEEVFKNQYSNLSFEERMASIFEDGKPTKITIAVENKIPYGYCVSKIDDGVGEIMTLHVSEAKRELGIGKKLTQLHIDWLKECNCNKIGLYVASGNAKTIKFYEQFGLKANLTYMQIKPEN